MRALVLTFAVLAPATALAWPMPAPEDPPLEEAEPAPEPPPEAEPAEPPPTPEELANRIDELEAKTKDLDRTKAEVEGTRTKVNTLMPLSRFITVFVDVGAFSVAGDGTGIRRDVGHLYYPQYDGQLAGHWVFMGDPLSTMINSLGEPADASGSHEITEDAIKSGGHPSVLVNSVGLSIGKQVNERVSVAALAELLPRPAHSSLDIELAYVEYRPSLEHNLVVQAGKIDSVLGVEYRAQDAPKRLTVTPSLICRYLCGRPLGVSARLVRRQVSASAAITNGDNFVERFEPNYTLKANPLPTVAGHLQYKLPVGQGLEVGISGAIGPQDGQPNTDLVQWHLGFDLKLTDFHGFDAVFEWVQGEQPGETMTIPCDKASCLSYKGGYVLVDRRVNEWFTPYVRVDWRDAVHAAGAEFLYRAHTLRTTVGATFAMTSRILGKVEYTMNRERDNIPQFPNDIITSSVVVATD